MRVAELEQTGQGGGGVSVSGLMNALDELLPIFFSCGKKPTILSL